MSEEPLIFSSWGGCDGIAQYILNKTGCKPYSGAGINPRINKNTTILKSVDNTFYYDDDLSDINNPKYTLFGHCGDQREDEKRFNEPLLNPEKTKHIYLYRVRETRNNKEYLWYGKYTIVSKDKKNNLGKDNLIRKIIVLSLKRI
jgi:hypothetical protein